MKGCSCILRVKAATNASRRHRHSRRWPPRFATTTLCWQRSCVNIGRSSCVKAVELAPERSQYWYDLGELAHIVGRRDVAKAAYSRYLQRHPDDAEVAHLLVSLGDETPPARVPDRCIQQLYARFSSTLPSDAPSVPDESSGSPTSGAGPD